MTEREKTDIKFEIVERIGVLNSYPTGWNKEFNVVRWNDKQEKYDIRDWAPGHERMSKGITLHSGEMKKLIELCDGRFSETQAAAPAAEPAPVVSDESGAASNAPF